MNVLFMMEIQLDMKKIIEKIIEAIQSYCN